MAQTVRMISITLSSIQNMALPHYVQNHPYVSNSNENFLPATHPVPETIAHLSRQIAKHSAANSLQNTSIGQVEQSVPHRNLGDRLFRRGICSVSDLDIERKRVMFKKNLRGIMHLTACALDA